MNLTETFNNLIAERINLFASKGIFLSEKEEYLFKTAYNIGLIDYIVELGKSKWNELSEEEFREKVYCFQSILIENTSEELMKILFKSLSDNVPKVVYLIMARNQQEKDEIQNKLKEFNEIGIDNMSLIKELMSKAVLIKDIGEQQ